MVIAMKGIFKGLKIIAKIFTAQKKHEIEIGYPTDVRHVSHIGSSAGDSSRPSWMNEFSGVEEASTRSVSCIAQSRQIFWASLDFEQTIGVLLPAEVYTDRSGHDAACAGKPSGHRKTRRKMKSMDDWSSSSSARSSSLRSTTSFATACDDLGELQRQSTGSVSPPRAPRLCGLGGREDLELARDGDSPARQPSASARKGSREAKGRKRRRGTRM